MALHFQKNPLSSKPDKSIRRSRSFECFAREKKRKRSKNKRKKVSLFVFLSFCLYTLYSLPKDKVTKRQTDKRKFNFMNDSFDYIWALLSPKAEYANRKRACYTLWLSFSMDERRKIYAILKRKLTNGQFVDFNPFFALRKAALAAQVAVLHTRPPEDIFLHGKPLFDAMNQHIPLVQVDIPNRTEGRYPVCTREDAEKYGLKIEKSF